MPYEILEPQAGYEMLPPAEPSLTDRAKQVGTDLVTGAVKGASDIGNTIIDLVNAKLAQPVRDAIPAQLRPPVGEVRPRAERESGVDQTLQQVGGDPNSLTFKGGRVLAQVAGTSGAGSLLAAPLRAVGGPVLNAIATGLETGGFRMPGISGVPGVLARAATGATVGGVSAGIVNPSDAPAGMAIGGTLPAATKLAGMAGDAVRRSMVGEVSPEVRALAQRAQELGIQVPADRLVNSRPLNAAAASLNYVPMSGRAATEDRMVSQLNQSLSRTFGQDSSNVTMALRKADSALGGQFDAFLKNNSVRMTPGFSSALDDAARQAGDELSADQAGIILKQIDNIRQKAGSGTIDGQTAYNIKKTLDRIGSRNSPEAWYALDLKGRLMDALNDSVGPDKAAAFSALRKQYGNMLSLQKLAKNGAEGEISAARLANLPNIRNPEVQELADIAAQFVKGREGAHGAAQRVSLGALTAGLGGWFGGPIGSAVAAGGLMAGGRTANGLLNSNAAKRLVLGAAPGAADAAPLGLLTQGVYRSVPLSPGLLQRE